MRLAYLNTRVGEIAVGVALLVIAAIVIREALRLGAGWGTSGPQSGFFPFWSAVVMAVAVVAALAQVVRAGSAKPLFDSPAEARSLLKVAVPMILAVASLPYLGLYLMTALYLGFFAAWYGRYRWYVVLAVSILVPVVLFFTFERGFRLALPKSVLYGDVIPF